MGMAMIDTAGGEGVFKASQASTVKRLFKHLQRQWRCGSVARRQLWRAYNASAYARTTPKCVWRRHGALLMYARQRKPLAEKVCGC
jgi:hypothetical protein